LTLDKHDKVWDCWLVFVQGHCYVLNPFRFRIFSETLMEDSPILLPDDEIEPGMSSALSECEDLPFGPWFFN
jgi:hypothetical protein